MAFEAGDWEPRAPRSGNSPCHQLGLMLMFRLLSEATLALGEGDHGRAAESLESVAPLVKVTTEPQWHRRVRCAAAGAAPAAGRPRRRPRCGRERTRRARALHRRRDADSARDRRRGWRVEADRAAGARLARERRRARRADTRPAPHAPPAGRGAGRRTGRAGILARRARRSSPAPAGRTIRSYGTRQLRRGRRSSARTPPRWHGGARPRRWSRRATAPPRRWRGGARGRGTLGARWLERRADGARRAGATTAGRSRNQAAGAPPAADAPEDPFG